MPLIHKGSKKAFEKNVKTEMEANPGDKHRAQNLAIAYSIKRKANHMSKGGIAKEYGAGPEKDLEPHMGSGYAKGGMVSEEYGAGPEKDLEPHMSPIRESYKSVPEDEYDADSFQDGSDVSMKGIRMAQGGEVSSQALHPDEYSHNMIEDSEYEPESIADAIRNRRAARMAKGGRAMAEGGQVDLEANSEESPNMEDQYSFRANGKEQYDLDQADYSKDDSEIGDPSEERQENEHDMISSLRSKIRAKRGMR